MKMQVFKNWLCSAVSAKLRACVPRFFSLSYRVFNLGICIPTLEFDESFLNRWVFDAYLSINQSPMNWVCVWHFPPTASSVHIT